MTSVILRNLQISYQISTGYLQVCYQITTKSLRYLQILHIYNISTRYLCASTTLYDSYDLYGNFQSLLMNRMKRWAQLGSACTGLVLQIRLLRHGKSTYGCGSRSRSSYIYMCVCVCVECMLPILLVQCSFLHYIYQSIQ